MNGVQSSPALEAFTRYTRAFRSQDPKAIATFFNQPALMITPQGVHALPNATAVEQMYARVIADMPRSYERTDFSRIEERRLGEDLSLVTGSGSWVDAAGISFMPFGMTYTLRRTGSDWRIVVAIIHSPDAK